MKISAIKTRIVEASSCTITELLSESISYLPSNSIVAITSKIVSLCEGNVVPVKNGNKDDIIEDEADYFLSKTESKYNIYLTIKRALLVPSSGVDESNSNGYYIKWPKDPQNSVNLYWHFLRERFKVKDIGVIITDSVSSPLRWGVTGKCIAYCGFKGLNNKKGEPDLFGRELRMTQINVADALAAAAVLCMGESNEQTPIAILEEAPFVNFEQHPPTHEEINSMHIDIEDDLYGQLLTGVEWKSRKKHI